MHAKASVYDVYFSEISILFCKYYLFCFIMCNDVFPACVTLHHMYSQWLWRAEEDFRSSRTRLTDCCEHHIDRYWESNPGTQEIYSVLLTLETSLQPLFTLFLKHVLTLNLYLIDTARWVCHQASGCLLCLSSLSWDYRHTPLNPALLKYQFWGSNSSIMPICKPFTHWPISLAPICIF